MTDRLFFFELSDGTQFIVSSTEFLQNLRRSGFYNDIKEFILSNDIALTGDFRSFPILFMCYWYYYCYRELKLTHLIDFSISYRRLSTGTTTMIYNKLNSSHLRLLQLYGVLNYAMFSSSLRLSEQIFKSRNWKKHYLIPSEKCIEYFKPRIF
uniref:Uncharacterized protein n=1 Tax=Dulem virus 199 TaxID=3145676 RepID=A0AAU8B662_9VIRU